MVTLCDAMSLENTTLPSSRFELYFWTTPIIITTIVIAISNATTEPMTIPIIAPKATEHNKQNE